MKKSLFLLLVLLMSAFMLASCNGDNTPTYFTVNFNSDGAEDYSPREIELGKTVIEPTAPTKAGYIFLGWYNGEDKWIFETDTVSANITLTAKWQRITFTVKFDSDGGSAVDSQTIPAGDFITEPESPTKKDCRFAGWYLGEKEWNFETDRITDYITLKAKWEPFPTYTVTFDSNGGSAVEPQYIVEGYKAKAPVTPTKKNANFIGWYNGDEPWDFENGTITANTTLTAMWEDIPTFTVSFNSNGAAAVEPQYVVTGGTANLPMTPDREQEGRLLGWYLGETLWDFNTPITADITLTAKWLNIYKITFVSDGTTVSELKLEEGTPVPKPNDPTKADYKFIGWYNDDKEWSFSDDIPALDTTLTAKWEHTPTYTVTFDSQGGSAVENQYVVKIGIIKEPANPTKEKHRFDGWYNGKEKWNFNTGTVSSNITLTAKWVETVTVSFDTGDTSLLSPITVDINTPIARPDELIHSSYLAKEWLLDGNAWDFGSPVTADMVLTAEWVRVYRVTFEADGITEEIPPQYVIEGETVKLVATPYKGDVYSFDGWYIPGTDIMWSFSEDTVTSDMILEARWSIMTPPDIWQK